MTIQWNIIRIAPQRSSYTQLLLEAEISIMKSSPNVCVNLAHGLYPVLSKSKYWRKSTTHCLEILFSHGNNTNVWILMSLSVFHGIMSFHWSLQIHVLRLASIIKRFEPCGDQDQRSLKSYSQALHKIIAAVQSIQNELNVYKQGLFLKWKGREYHEIFISEGDEETTWL